MTTGTYTKHPNISIVINGQIWQKKIINIKGSLDFNSDNQLLHTETII